MPEATTLEPCLTATEARKITDEKLAKDPPKYGVPDAETVARAKNDVRDYFKRRVESSLRRGNSSLSIEVEGSANNMYAFALARELVAFLRALGFQAAYGPHVTRYADELEDDEFWPVLVNW